MGEFQFHKGAIRTYIRHVPRLHRSPFQFHKGAIRTYLRRNGRKGKIYFNSIKVRLELGTHQRCTPFRLFQFHKGAIRTCHQVARELSKEQFQFHKGAIRTQLPIHLTLLVLNFNSIKVRLEPEGG